MSKACVVGYNVYSSCICNICISVDEMYAMMWHLVECDGGDDLDKVMFMEVSSMGCKVTLSG